MHPWGSFPAHCQTENTEIVEVVLGEWDVLTDPDCPIDEEGCNNPRVQRKKVEELIVHQGYSRKTNHNDLALIRMRTEVRLHFCAIGLPS